MIDYLIAAFSGPGSFFMWIITAIIAWGLAIFVERCWALLWLFRHDQVKIEEHLRAGKLEKAAELSARSPLSKVISAGAGASTAEEAWDRMGSEAAAAEEQLTGRAPFLAVIGNVATMLGLLGTVYGLIIAFSALGDASAGEQAVRLSEGISTAMATTAYGLVAGIPALLAHAWIDSKIRSQSAEIEAAAGLVAASLR